MDRFWSHFKILDIQTNPVLFTSHAPL